MSSSAPENQSTMSSSPHPTKKPTSLAILDDYPNISPPHFHPIPDLTLTTYPITLNPSLPSDLQLLIHRLHPYEIISTMRERTPFPAPLLHNLPHLKLLLTTGLRNASIDLPAATERGIFVAGTTGAGRRSPADEHHTSPPPPRDSSSAVIQHAWALLLSLCGRIPQDDRALKTVPGSWQGGVGVSLWGKRLGIVGFGRLGGLMARLAVRGFGMEVVVWSAGLESQEEVDRRAGKVGLGIGVVRFVGREELFRTADVVSLHLVLGERSRGTVGRRELGWMKGSAVLVNTSRGPLVDEGALVEVLREGRIRGAALDVFDTEPLPEDSVWREADGFKSLVVLSPHMGYVNEETLNRWYEEQAENVERWLKGEEVLNRLN